MAQRGSIRGLVCLAGCVLAAGIAFLVINARLADGNQQTERQPAVAGAFYPDDPRILRDKVQAYLQQARPEVPEGLQEAAPRVLIVPHAGYVYSGQTAAYAYKLLQGRKKPSRVILLGPSHFVRLDGVCGTDGFTHYVTPLGKVPVDLEARARLVETGQVELMQAAHAPEHCLEVQLPFLQILWPEPASIVPILVQELHPEHCRAAAVAVAAVLDEDSLVVVSTDFTHYGPRFGFSPFAGTHGSPLAEKIKELDMGAVQEILALNPSGLHEYLSRTRATICGHLPVSIALELFSRSKACRPVFLRWSNSGDVTHDYEDCVSYVAMAIYAPASSIGEIKEALGAQSLLRGQEPGYGGPELSEEDRHLLLGLARAAVTAAADPEATAPRPDLDQMPEAVRARCGAFVTLRKDGQLRGCIGHIQPDRPLCVTVCQMARLAAVEDPRFPPLAKDELAQVRIEISALGPLRAVKRPDQIQVGQDGLVVSRGLRSGLLLPQVATEQGWTVQEFLEQTCLKAGLPPDTWQKEGVSIQSFAATVFGEPALEPD